MKQTKLMRYFYLSVILSVVLFSGFYTFASPPERFIIKNVSVFKPDGTWQEDSFVIVKGCKIEQIGRMNTLEQTDIFDHEYDLKGKFLYPAFIDAFYKGFQVEEKEASTPGPARFDSQISRFEERQASEKDDVRAPFEKRNYFIKRKAVERLLLTEAKMKEVIEQGFAILHIAPPDGIYGGTATVISMISENPTEAVLVPETFMTLYLKPNQPDYPSTFNAIIAELQQLKEDSTYYQKMKRFDFSLLDKRLQYIPEYDILYPYFTKEKRFIISISNYPEQRLIEQLTRLVGIDPILVGHPEIWRRPLAPNTTIILPLNFKPNDNSYYAQFEEKLKKEAEEKIYPQKLAEFLKSHPHIAITSPDGINHKDLFKNLQLLGKNGAPESLLIAALTINPAKILDIARYTGSCEAGKLANITVSDKKITEPDARVSMTVVEGKVFEFKPPADKDKKDEKDKKPGMRKKPGGLQ